MTTQQGVGVGKGATLSELYQTSRHILLKTKQDLSLLESSNDSSPDLSTSIRTNLSHVQTLCKDMDSLYRSVASKPQRDLWKRKVEQIAEEADSQREGLDRYFQRRQKRMQEAQERAELLNRANGESSHVMRIFDEEAQAMQSARNSSRMLEEATATGTAILAKYSEQRDRLKGAQRKALDVLNTLGLSNTILRVIERRNRVDQRIKYAGMILTFIIVVAFLRWVR
ncbi:membrin 12 [Artemisia annua]|uniref:Membrin n=1 Tax=Artemisia annua TaxID=35608 RepID=A0A2U1PZF9_ARTAN|nr:membrin 12 [Artemisia annua]